MITSLLKKGIFVSLIGHLAVFGIFSFSFGRLLNKAEYTSVSFWGPLFGKADFKTLPAANSLEGIKRLFNQHIDRTMIDKKPGDYGFLHLGYLKPQSNLAYSKDKEEFGGTTISFPRPARRKDSAIIFHPPLPYEFELYFKDRQVVHVELVFNIKSLGRRNYVVVKRKVSSGNLEADLLIKRYIDHYLFIQKARFTPDTWQAVKIDLSPKND